MTEIIYDVFISHAFEDKGSFANELAFALKEKGLKVWYSGFELKVGDSIAKSVNKALKGAAYGVVVISPIYLEKQWAMSEFNALLAQEADHNRILPILHNITVDELKKLLPVLADRYTVSTDKGLEFIVNKIMEVIKDEKAENFDTYKKKTSQNSRTDSGFITLGGKSDINDPKAGRDQKNKKKVSTNSNKNTNNVTVNAGDNNTATIVIILIVIAIVAYVAFGEFDLFSSSDTPVNKEFSRPSNSP